MSLKCFVSRIYIYMYLLGIFFFRDPSFWGILESPGQPAKNAQNGQNGQNPRNPGNPRKWPKSRNPRIPDPGTPESQNPGNPETVYYINDYIFCFCVFDGFFSGGFPLCETKFKGRKIPSAPLYSQGELKTSQTGLFPW